MHSPEEKISLPPEILEAIELTKESNFTPEQLLAYDKYIDAIRTEASIKADAHKAGKAEGEVIGKTEGLKTGALKLKKSGLLTVQQIVEVTGLSEEEINLL